MSKIRVCNSKLMFSSLFFILLLAPSLAQSASSGIGDDAENGCLCHGSKSQSTIVTIEGLPQQWVANQTYDLAIIINSTIEQSQDIDASLGGFRLMIDDGLVLFEESNYSQIIDEGYTHTSQGNAFLQWNFTWTAPASNDTVVTFVAHGNAVNSDQQTTGDAWNYHSSSVAGEGFTGVIEEPPNYSGDIGNSEIALLIFAAISLIGLFYYSTK